MSGGSTLAQAPAGTLLARLRSTPARAWSYLLVYLGVFLLGVGTDACIARSSPFLGSPRSPSPALPLPRKRYRSASWDVDLGRELRDPLSWDDGAADELARESGNRPFRDTLILTRWLCGARIQSDRNN